MYDGWRYYQTVLQRARWDKPLYLGSLDIVYTAPTYAMEQAAIMVQGVWRKRQGWKMLMAAMASVWSKTVDPSTGAVYYYNYRTGEAKWEKPLLFGGKDVEDFAGQLEEMQTKQREKVKRGKGASSLSLAAQALSFSLSLARCLLWLVFTPPSLGWLFLRTHIAPSLCLSLETA